MVYARYSCSYTITRASSCGNVSRERLQVRSAVCTTAAGSASAPPSAKATSRPSSSQRAVQSASCSDVHCSPASDSARSEEHTSELQSLAYLVCRLLLEKKKSKRQTPVTQYATRT